MAGLVSKFRRIDKNNLITVNRDSSPLFLMGLVSSKKVKEDAEGWIYIISPNPLTSHNVGQPYRNKLLMEKLLLTPDQQINLIRHSMVRDGYVYLYAGNFVIGKCQNAFPGQPENFDMNLLQALKRRINPENVTFDSNVVAKISELLLNQLIIPPEIPKRKKSESDLHKLGQLDHLLKRLAILEKNVCGKEQLKFRVEGNEIFVELDCPANHPEYHVGVFVLETFVYKSQGAYSSSGIKNFTKIVKQADIKIKADMGSQYQHGFGSSEYMTMVIKGFNIPKHPEAANPQIFAENQVLHVEYRGMAHFIRNGKWEEKVIKKLLTIPNPVYLPKAGTSSGSSGGSGIGYSSRETASASGGGYSASLLSGASAYDPYKDCPLPVKLILLEAEIQNEKEDDDEYTAGCQPFRRSST